MTYRNELPIMWDDKEEEQRAMRLVEMSEEEICDYVDRGDNCGADPIALWKYIQINKIRKR